MGTRGSFGFQINGKLKVTYNHFDSYPEGLGGDVIGFMENRDADNIKELKKKVEALQFVDKSKKPTQEQIDACDKAGTIDLGVSDQSKEDWYCLLRGAQGDLEKILEIGLMSDGESFLQDSLFCEYAYIINLDTVKLEVYKGFRKEPPVGRFADSKVGDSEDGGYYPVSLVYECSFDDMPEDGEALNEILYPEGEDEE
ncbi:hypothetical protein KAR91_53240 [Candidatus Pacearchaeota archaeon]|nr:hypothetical protein [Candidatus Pacearchaeota archaeon]